MRISKDQMGERSVVVIVLSKRSTIWRKTSMRALIREEQLRCIDVEEMRVFTNDKHIAEQIKTDEMESVVMNGSKVGKCRKIDGKQNLKSIVMNGVQHFLSKRDKLLRRLLAVQSLKGRLFPSRPFWHLDRMHPACSTNHGMTGESSLSGSCVLLSMWHLIACSDNSTQ